MDATIRVESSRDQEADLRSLCNWLRQADELRGSRVERVAAPIRPGQMGGVSDALVVALGTGGAGVVLAQSISVWLQTRVADIKVKITGPKGTAEIDGQRIRDPASLLDQVRKILGEQ
jgi:hypothetical protein